jgi:hypothetical protein
MNEREFTPAVPHFVFYRDPSTERCQLAVHAVSIHRTTEYFYRICARSLIESGAEAKPQRDALLHC